MNPTLARISQPLTATQLRKRVLQQLVILSVNNGHVSKAAVRKP